MQSGQAKCPKCNSEYAYADGNFWVCPECAHEWSLYSTPNEETEAKPQEAVVVGKCEGQFLAFHNL
jgi:alkylphosphonate utilization operon protein PhnA